MYNSDLYVLQSELDYRRQRAVTEASARGLGARRRRRTQGSWRRATSDAD